MTAARYTVNRELINRWMQGKAMPVAELQVLALVSDKTAMNALKGKVPGRAGTRRLIAQAMGYRVEQLYQEVKRPKK